MSVKLTFVDSNVWLYAWIKSDSQKHRTAKAVIRKINPAVISSQVISEVCVNLLKKAGRGEPFIRELIQSFHAQCEMVQLTEAVFLEASRLRERYALSYWDSTICGAALQAGCDTLVTEDMQHGLRIDNRLTILNPFI